MFSMAFRAMFRQVASKTPINFKIFWKKCRQSPEHYDCDDVKDWIRESRCAAPDVL
jgi:hypothetical protein